MGVGLATAAPTGYLDFCRRQAEDCGGAPPAVVRKVAEIELARRNDAEARYMLAGRPATTTAAVSGHGVNWSQAFAEARLRREAAEQSTAMVEAAMAKAQPLAAESTALIRVSASAQIETPHLQRLGGPAAASARAAVGKPAASNTRSPAPPAMTPELWSQLTRINDRVNRAIVRRSDIQTYGALDHWATPLAQGDQFGDCEDYVLEKRRALLAAGVPETALSIAVANTSWGESHAVLVVSTDQGDYVLDSLTPWILPWRKTSLTWRERQVAGAPFRWAMVSLDPVVSTPVIAVAEPSDGAEAHIKTDGPAPPSVAAPLRRLHTESFTGRPNGTRPSTETQDAPEPVMTLALASGSPLRGLLR